MSIARHHAEWLSLVPVSGPFLSLPVLMEAFNTGLEPHDPEHVRLLRQEYANWQESFEKRKADPAPHHNWIKFVLTKTLELDDRVLTEGQAIPQTLQVEIPEHHELLRPSIVVNDPGTKKARLLVQTYPRSQELTSYVAGSPWKASPDTRMTELLHGTGVRLGLVTNGEHWMLVDAPKGETTGYASWYASLWLEEYITLRAFRSLLSASRFFNVPDDQTLEALLAKSASNQQEVTDQLGYQVRRAVEVLIHSLDRADQDFGRELLADVSPEQLYESALTVMMRLVFLFCAEERELIPSKPFPVYEQNYSVSTISKQLRELADQHGEELLERRYDAWPRLLAAFRAVYGGLKHDDVHIPAYGGNLFNPDRFPFLEGRNWNTTWRVAGGGWREQNQGRNGGSETLSRTRSVATSDGLGDGMLSSHEAVPEGRTVRDDESDSPSRSVDSSQYRRGTGPRVHEGVSEFPQHQSGVLDGIRNTPTAVSTSRIVNTNTTRSPPRNGRSDQPNVVGTPQSAGSSSLIPPPATHHPPRFQEANPLPVNNRTVLHLLEALQLLQIKVPGGGPAEARRLSFRALDIEQIGHVYEGLLDHTAKRSTEPYLGLAGTRDKEPELPLAKLEELLAKGEADLVKFLKDETGKSDSALKKSLKVELDKHDAARFRTACQSDNALWKRVEPLAGLVRQDNFGYPVVIPKGSVFVTSGTDRRSSGTHYTPRSLTEPIVQYTLEPLVYVGPAEGKPKGEWKLKSAKELLELKICDMACGSGAFLVQAARYMAERLMEAWDEARDEARGEGLGARGENGGEDGSPALSRVDRLAEGDGAGQALLPTHQSVSKVGAVRDDEPDQEVGSVDPGQHSGGKRTGAHQGIPESPEHRTGFASGTGDAPNPVPRSRTLEAGRSEQVSELGRRNQPHAGSSPYFAGTPSLTSSLAPRPSPLAPRITPDGRPATGALNEELVPDDPAERMTYAMRIIAQRCLYGVDKNPLAAEMAKLSLWLLTLAKDKPFEFLDHSIRCGDSLVGLHSIDQLRHYSLKPDADDAVLFKGPLDSAVDEAINLRLKLEDMPANSVDDVQRQEKLLIEANEKIARLRCAADLLVAAEFWAESAKDKLERVRHASNQSVLYFEKGPTDEFERIAVKKRRGQTMFHWPLEFPEVIVKRGGFDAFVGNPPFMAGRAITGQLGDFYLDVLRSLAGGSVGQTDLCAYFFLRSFGLLRYTAAIAFVATNTISQGDTSAVALATLLNAGATVFRAVPSQQWPGEAAVFISLVHIYKGDWRGVSTLNGQSVELIDAKLQAISVEADPQPLLENAGKSFKGYDIGGLGFTFTPDEYRYFISEHPEESSVIHPYINGLDFYSSPTQQPSRYAINFVDMRLDEAAAFPACLQRVRDLVKPQRDKVNRQRNRERWWLYSENRPGMRQAIAECQYVVAKTQTSKTWAFSLLPATYLFDQKLVVIPTNDMFLFAVLQSEIHYWWAERQGSSLKGDMAYTPSDCFQTYPFPSERSTFALRLKELGHRYYECRNGLMRAQREGLTATYNRLHNPDETNADTQKLRDLHVEMDKAVAAAYGWTDLDLGHGFHETKQGVRFTISEPARREVLQRLLKLNHERYAEEVKQGLHGKKGAAKKAAPKKKAASKPAKQEASLFDGEDDE